ncbi:hypothetical protein [Bacillus massiliigorillae]|uniref:hypothetical protein n=1 Tax=Bacillus massiliigorillae TaxID=1243664 RepID=UPI00039C1DD5|nr:hypothetical protein [Bacillus massiliigorillae]
MKRYSTSIIFTIIVLASTACFYIFFSARSETVPSLSIKTVSGNQDEMKDVKIYGEGFINNVSSTVTVTEKKATVKPVSALNLWFGQPNLDESTLKIAQLQEQYRSFMRGKQNIDELYEDKTLLLFAESNNAKKQLEIEYYDKLNNTSHEFTLSLPKEYSKYKDVFVHDIQLIDQQMVVVLGGHVPKRNDIFLLYVNLKQEKINHSKTVYSLEHSKTEDQSIYINNFEQNLELATYYTFQVAKSVSNEPTIYTMYAIDLHEGQLKQIHLPDKTAYDWDYYKNDNKIYYLSTESGELYQIDLEKNSTSLLLQNDKWKNSNGLTMTASDNKLYIMSGLFTPVAKIDVVGVNNKKMLYEGKIKLEKSVVGNNFSFRTIMVN